MTILAFATGVSDLVQKESTQNGTTSSSDISDYVYEGLTYNGTNNYPITTSNSTLVFGDTSGDLWVSDTVKTPGSGFISDDLDLFYISASGQERDDNYCFGIKTSDGPPDLDLVWYNGTEEVRLVTEIGSTYDITTLGVAVRIDINFRYGTDGGFDLYIDRDLVYSSDFDTTVMGRIPNKVRLGTARVLSTLYTYHSSIIVADEDTTLLTMVQFELESDGTFTDFTGDYSYLQTFGETGDNYSVESSEAGDVATYKFTSRASEISGGTVVGLGLSCRAKTQEAVSADQFRFVTYDGTDTAYSGYIEMDQYITPYQTILTTNPAGDAWTLADIATHEFGFEVSENG